MKRLYYRLFVIILLAAGMTSCSKNMDYNSDGNNPIGVGNLQIKEQSFDNNTRAASSFRFREGDVLTITATAENKDERNYISNYTYSETTALWLHDETSDAFNTEDVLVDYTFKIEINKGRWTNMQDSEQALHISDYIAGPGEIRDSLLHSATLVPLTHQYVKVKVNIEEGNDWQRAGGFETWMKQSTVKLFHPGATEIVKPSLTYNKNRATYTAILKPGSIPRPNGSDVLLSLDPNVAGENIIHLKYNTILGQPAKAGQEATITVPYHYDTGMHNGWATVSDWKY